MRRYLLLASVAGCLIANNAMAGTVDPDGQSATIGVGVGMQIVDVISKATDIDFGTLLATTSRGGDLVRLDNDGNITKLSENLAGAPATGTAGTLTLSSDIWHTGFGIECAWDGKDISASTDNFCPLAGESASGFYVKKVTISGSEGSYTIGATLGSDDGTGTSDHAISPGVIRVVLQYQ